MNMRRDSRIGCVTWVFLAWGCASGRGDSAGDGADAADEGRVDGAEEFDGRDVADADSTDDACSPGALEVCDGLDNDCDGSTDEGFDLATDPGNCGACGVPCSGLPHADAVCSGGTCLIGACLAGWVDANGGPDDGCEYACVAVAPAESADDGTCDNGTDDDCDGRTDATDPDCVECVPELCDGVDDDCDGRTDEDFDLDSDVLNCGGCGRYCARRPHAAPACVLGECAVACEAGWIDADGLLANGCEAVCVPVEFPDETECDGSDDDCDGSVDEDWAPIGSCGLGFCVRADVCHRGAVTCRPRSAPSSSDTTCDALDDDCDGSTDEDVDCAPGTVEVCAAPCGTAGTRACDAACEWGPCVPPPEACNGADDDCDGGTDEEWFCPRGAAVPCATTCGSAGTGTCTTACEVPPPADCVPPAESCNRLDDDCDTLTDEECAPGIDVNGDGYGDLIVGSAGWGEMWPDPIDWGRADIFFGGPTGLGSSPDWTVEPAAGVHRAHFGWAVGSAGDVNGDGYDDVVAGAENWGGETVGEGRAHLYLGGPSGPATAPARVLDPTGQGGSYFGYSVGTAGDVNADGFDDMAVSAPRWTGTEMLQGCVYVYLGSPTGIIDPLGCVADPVPLPSAYFGLSVAGAGSVDGDRYGDLLVGADNWRVEFPTAEGRAYLYPGGPSGLAGTFAWSADPADQTGASFGNWVAGAGDVNGDGYGDAIVGARAWDDTIRGVADEGRAYLYLGSASGLRSDPAWTVDPADVPLAAFGTVVAGAGDVNGDGYDDVVVGAPYWADAGGPADEGRAYVFLGSPSGLRGTPDWWTDPADQAGAFFGRAVAGGLDVNADGYSDLVVSAYQWDGDAVNEGRVYLFLGGRSGLDTSPVWTADPTDEISGGFGTALASAPP